LILQHKVKSMAIYKKIIEEDSITWSIYTTSRVKPLQKLGSANLIKKQQWIKKELKLFLRNNEWKIDISTMNRINRTICCWNSGFFCGNTKLCPICNQKTHNKECKILGVFFDQKQEVIKDNNFYHITLTFKDNNNIKVLKQHVLSSIKKLNYNRIKEKNSVFSVFNWFIIKIEKKKESNLWNFHLHIIATTKLNLNIEEAGKRISAEWKKITKDSWIVDIRKIAKDSENTLRLEVMKVFSYINKFDFYVKVKDLVDFSICFKWVSCFKKTGIFLGYKWKIEMEYRKQKMAERKQKEEECVWATEDEIQEILDGIKTDKEQDLQNKQDKVSQIQFFIKKTINYTTIKKYIIKIIYLLSGGFKKAIQLLKARIQLLLFN